MKFLFVSPIYFPDQLEIQRANLPLDAPDPLFPTNMGEHFMVKALRALGHEVCAFYPDIGVLPLFERFGKHWVGRGLSQLAPHLNPDYRQRNNRLAALSRDIRPDVLIFAGNNEVIYPETIASIKAETNTLVLMFSYDSPIVFTHANEQVCAQHYDLAVVNDLYHGMQWRELGTTNMVVLPLSGCDPDFHHPYKLNPDNKQRHTCDVGFVGTLIPEKLYRRRVDLLAGLREFDLGIWSVHAVPTVLRPYARGSALGQDMLRMMSATKIAINIHGNSMLYGGNMRLFELAAIGTFQIVDDLPGIPEWFTPGEHLVTFKDAADLREKVAYYLAHPEERQRIAEAARQHVYAHHTYRQRMEKLVATIEGIREQD